MTIQVHKRERGDIAEIRAEGILIRTAQDGLDLMGNIYYQGFDSVILHEQNISPEFFDLKTGLAGEILQKFSNYRIRLAIVGDFSKYTAGSRSLHDFIFESNKQGLVSFVASAEEALQKLSV